MFSAGTFVRSGIPQNPELLPAVTRESWIAERMIDMPVEDMTRAWYTSACGLSEGDPAMLRRLESRRAVKQKLTNAIRWAWLCGGFPALTGRPEVDRGN